MNIIEDIYIFVENFSFTLSEPCLSHAWINPKIKISFFLDGNFKDACFKDELNSLHDYEAICQKLIKTIEKPISCHNESHVLAIMDAMIAHSPWIFKCHMDITTICIKQVSCNKTMVRNGFRKFKGPKKRNNKECSGTDIASSWGE